MDLLLRGGEGEGHSSSSNLLCWCWCSRTPRRIGDVKQRSKQPFSHAARATTSQRLHLLPSLASSIRFLFLCASNNSPSLFSPAAMLGEKLQTRKLTTSIKVVLAGIGIVHREYQ
jgi:hypothetical protein